MRAWPRPSVARLQRRRPRSPRAARARGSDGRFHVGEHASAAAWDVDVAAATGADSARARRRRRHVARRRRAHRLHRRLGQLPDARHHAVDDLLDARLVHRGAGRYLEIQSGSGGCRSDRIRTSTLEALLAHARALVGVELGELADALGLPVPFGRVRTKGWSGPGDRAGAGRGRVGGTRGPDFAALGVELKTVPGQRSDLVPLESTAVCQIDPIAIAGESWETSYVREKLARVLFVALEVPRAPARSASAGWPPCVSGRPTPTRARVLRDGLRAVRARLLPRRARRRHHRPPGRRACRCAPRGATPPICATATTPPGQPGPRRQARLLPAPGLRRAHPGGGWLTRSGSATGLHFRTSKPCPDSPGWAGFPLMVTARPYWRPE